MSDVVYLSLTPLQCNAIPQVVWLTNSSCASLGCYSYKMCSDSVLRDC